MVDKITLQYAAVAGLVGVGAGVLLGRTVLAKKSRKNPTKRLGSGRSGGRRKNPTHETFVSPSRRVLMAAHFRRQTPEKIRQSLKAINMRINELTRIERSAEGPNDAARNSWLERHVGSSLAHIKAQIAEQRVTESIAARVLREKSGVRSNPASSRKHKHGWKPIPGEMGKYYCEECKSVGKREGGSIVPQGLSHRLSVTEWDTWPKHGGTRRVSWRGDTYGHEDVTYRDRDRENPTGKKTTKKAKRKPHKPVARKRHAKPFQVESRSGSKRFATKAQAIAYAKKLKSNGHSSRVAGPTGPLAMFAGSKEKALKKRTHRRS